MQFTLSYIDPKNIHVIYNSPLTGYPDATTLMYASSRKRGLGYGPICWIAKAGVGHRFYRTSLEPKGHWMWPTRWDSPSTRPSKNISAGSVIDLPHELEAQGTLDVADPRWGLA